MTSNAVLVGYFCDITRRERPEATVMLSEIGCSRVFEDTQSSSDTELRKAVAALRPGDTLLVPKLDSLGMNLRGMMSFIIHLSSEGIHFRAAREGIDTREAIRPAHLCELLLEAQDELRRAKIKNGMSEAQKRGEGTGRPRVLRREDVLAFRELIGSPGVTVRKAADSLGINISTVRKRARALGIRLRTGQASVTPSHEGALSDEGTQGSAFGKARRRPGRPRALKPEDVVAFRQLVETSGLSVKRAASELGVSQAALRKWARDLGISLRRRTYTVKLEDRGPVSRNAQSGMPAQTNGGWRRRPRKLLPEDVQAFRDMVETSGHSVSEAAIALGVCESTLRKYAHALAIRLPGRRNIARVRDHREGLDCQVGLGTKRRKPDVEAVR